MKEILPPKGRNGLLSIEEAKKLEYSLVELMMEGVIEGKLLIECGQWLTPELYDSIVAERNCGGWCGYPRCRTQDVEKIKFINNNNRRWKWNWKEKYCSKDCYNKSEFFKRQLSKEVLFMRRIEDTNDIVLLEDYRLNP